jgi:hypothetical protein
VVEKPAIVAAVKAAVKAVVVAVVPKVTLAKKEISGLDPKIKAKMDWFREKAGKNAPKKSKGGKKR